MFTGATWARVLGIGIASISAIANFLFVPILPVLVATTHRYGHLRDLGARDWPSRSAMEAQQAEMMAGAYGGDMTQTGSGGRRLPAAGRNWAGEPVKETGAGR